MKALQVILDVLNNGTFRRALVALLTLGAVALNKKFGLNLDAEGFIALVATSITYMVQSASKEASVARSELMAEAVAPKLIQPASPSQVP